MISYSFRFLAPAAAVLLTACGGGGGTEGHPGGSIEGQNGHIYRDLETSEQTSIPLGGAALRNSASNGRDTTNVQGTLSRPTGSISVSDPDYIFNAPSGLDANGRATDANGAQVELGQDSRIGGYEYLTTGTIDYATPSGPTTAIIVVGAVTQGPDMPVTGSATYSGTALVDEFSANCNCRHTGDATVVADFGNGTVTATLGDFTTTSSNTALPPVQNFDTIIVADMSINGSNMNGSTVITELNGTPVTLFGNNPNVSATGTFFGLDHAGHPDEVGGVFIVDGNGAVMGVFVAD